MQLNPWMKLNSQENHLAHDVASAQIIRFFSIISMKAKLRRKIITSSEILFAVKEDSY